MHGEKKHKINWMLKPSKAPLLLSNIISSKTFCRPITALPHLPLPKMDPEFISFPACSLVHLLTTVFPLRPYR